MPRSDPIVRGRGAPSVGRVGDACHATLTYPNQRPKGNKIIASDHQPAYKGGMSDLPYEAESGFGSTLYGWRLMQLDDDTFERTQRSTAMSPERRLLFAVLRDAIEVLRVKKDSPTHARARQEVIAWILAEPDLDWPFSFEFICRELGFDPAYIRKGVRPWFKSPPVYRGRGRPRKQRA